MQGGIQNRREVPTPLNMASLRLLAAVKVVVMALVGLLLAAGGPLPAPAEGKKPEGAAGGGNGHGKAQGGGKAKGHAKGGGKAKGGQPDG